MSFPHFSFTLPRMDVWEHAYLLDYKPAEKSKYIEAFFANIDWEAVEARFEGGRVQRAA